LSALQNPTELFAVHLSYQEPFVDDLGHLSFCSCKIQTNKKNVSETTSGPDQINYYSTDLRFQPDGASTAIDTSVSPSLQTCNSNSSCLFADTAIKLPCGIAFKSKLCIPGTPLLLHIIKKKGKHNETRFAQPTWYTSQLQLLQSQLFIVTNTLMFLQIAAQLMM
jgi:hypothetical protein